MCSPLRKLSRDDGASAVEFAIVLPLLVLLVFGIIEFSIAYNRAQGLHAAAREGARVGALPSTSQDQIEARVHDALEGVLAEPGDAAVSVTPGGTRPCATEGDVLVTVTYDNEIDIPLWGTQTVTLTGKGKFHCETGGPS